MILRPDSYPAAAAPQAGPEPGRAPVRGSLRAGGRDNGGPGLRPDRGPTYNAALLIDVDGNNVEAVCLEAG